MPSTPIYALPYPAAADPADVPVDMQELAERVEAVLPEQIAYAELTANISCPANTSADVVSSGAVTYDGKPILIEFYAPALDVGAPSGVSYLALYDGATELGWLALAAWGTVGGTTPVLARRRLTPTPGSHTYRIRLGTSNTAGGIRASAGGPGLNLPAYIRITKAA